MQIAQMQWIHCYFALLEIIFLLADRQAAEWTKKKVCFVSPPYTECYTVSCFVKNHKMGRLHIQYNNA